MAKNELTISLLNNNILAGLVKKIRQITPTQVTTGVYRLDGLTWDDSSKSYISQKMTYFFGGRLK